MDGAALVPLDERQIDFYGDEIVAVLVEEAGQATVYVPLRPLCAHLGLSWSGQRERVLRDEVLAEALRSVRLTRTEAGERELACLPLEYLPGWLFGVSVARIRPELRDKMIRYRRECFRALWQAFQGEALARAAAGGDSLAHIRSLGLAIAQMAEQQMALEQRVATADTRLDRAAAVVGELRRRLGAVEQQLRPGAPISEAQAGELSAAVKALGELLTSRQPGKNHYQAIFAELYRRFGVSSYRAIAQADYAAVLAFLSDWRAAAAGGAGVSEP